MRAATDEQFERLKSSLRPRTFMARVVNGRRYYVYSDPNLCKCVFLGDEVAMQSYRDLLYVAAGSNAPNAAPATPSAPVLTEEMDENLSRREIFSIIEGADRFIGKCARNLIAAQPS
jgi:hypothetical protein